MESHSIDCLAAVAPAIAGVRAEDVQPGDWVIVRTKNSVYSLRARGDGTFDVHGGWFAREAQPGVRMRVAGCTWGGSALFTQMIAAPDMFLEFANNVMTTRIREVRLLRPVASAIVH